MILAVVVLALAVLTGWLAGGSLHRLGGLSLRTRRLIALALLAQLLGGLVGGPTYPAGIGLSAVLVATFLVRNRGVCGTGLLTTGLLLNAVVIAANGAMPVADSAAGRAGVSTQDIVSGADRRHRLSTERTRLRWLSDTVPVPWPGRGEVVSPGDLLVAAGLAQLVVAAMLGSAPAAGPTALGRRRTGAG